MTNIALLGSTGSIGRQVLDVVSRLPEKLRVVSLAAHRNVELLAMQIAEFGPELAAIGSEDDAGRLAEAVSRQLSAVSPECPHPGPLPLRLRSTGEGERVPEVVFGEEGLRRVAVYPEADIVVVAVAGTVGLAPTLAAISAGKDIALASKEVLVAAGHLVTRMAAEKGVKLLPIDSEHSAIFQCLEGQDRTRVKRIMLTSSGGAFRDYPIQGLQDVTVEQALAHPTWSMGRKITVDSATLMNKGLEIIEAHWLFRVDASRIEVVIHPQSIVHSMVEFDDGSVLAQMGVPDMRLPIQYALIYPERTDTCLPRLEIVEQGQLTFARPDPARYPALELAYRAAEVGGTMPVVMNAANEVAVQRFLDGRIGFLDIVKTVRRVMQGHNAIADPSLDQILEADSLARTAAAE